MALRRLSHKDEIALRAEIVRLQAELARVVDRYENEGRRLDAEMTKLEIANARLNDVVRTVPRVRGIGRVADNPYAILLYFDIELSDDQIRALHEEINEFIAIGYSSPDTR